MTLLMPTLTTNDRHLIITWDDPLIGAETGKSLAGLDYMNDMIAGKVPAPPIARLLDFRLVEVAHGRAVFECEPGEQHYNPIGVVHGGLASTLLDSALGCCVHTTLPAGTGYTTVELHVNLLRPLTKQTGIVRCEAEVIHVGRSMATAQGRLVDAAGKLYAHGTTTCMIFRPG